MDGKLTRVSSRHNNLRTSETVGVYTEVPTPGRRFSLYAHPLSADADIRVIETTQVLSVVTMNWHEHALISAAEPCNEGCRRSYHFRTANSEYRLDVTP